VKKCYNRCKLKRKVVKLVFKKEMNMLNIEKFMYDLSNGLSLEKVVSLYKLNDKELVSILNDYVSSIDVDCKEEFLFYEEEGNFDILNKFGFGFLIG
jgi:hypothetical protein